ncbi:4Fe-4S single cluster domain-containing protein [Paenibacillus sp. Leaf72]|uniref:4Fe-4S single cluster domain-containing protein n=1 Tax=Paenibacillus sp. Leaf72 TaxID=1736234 RepID=UPI0006F2468F|nr:4Fe-4S single cluster domain-containing protein [Paenibacillus sp. Leaf72]KQN96861.1 hypothetical protein ASF12_22595 [Paenibacillus sp. Leaf72]
MKIHAFTQYSTVNGPGERMVIHFQGCKFQCAGCFNPETHSLDNGLEMSVEDIKSLIPSDIDGITISGGEPFLQQSDLLTLTVELRKLGLPIIIFSGFYHHEIIKLKYGQAILNEIDVLIDGRFVENKISQEGLHGSNNQTMHFFTDQYCEEDFKNRDTEVTFLDSGLLTITGFPNESLLNVFKS